MSSADNLCKQFEPRLCLTVYQPTFNGDPDLLDQNLLSLIVFLKELFEKVNFEEKSKQTPTKA